MCCCCVLGRSSKKTYLSFQFVRAIPIPLAIIGLALVASSFGTPAEESIGGVEVTYMGISTSVLVESAFMIVVHPLFRDSTTCNPWHRFVMAGAIAGMGTGLVFRTIYLDKHHVYPRCVMMNSTRRTPKVDLEQKPCQLFTYKITAGLMAIGSGIAYLITAFSCTMTIPPSALSRMHACRRGKKRNPVVQMNLNENSREMQMHQTPNPNASTAH